MSDDSKTNPYAGSAQPYPGAPAQNAPVYPAPAAQQPRPPAPPAVGGHQQAQLAQSYPPQQPYAAPQQPYASPQQPYASGQPYAAPLPTSGLAVASLVTGIAGIVLSFAVFPLLASLAAIVTGHMALKQTRQGSGIGGRGMAIAGLILGYVGVAILALIVIVSIFSFLFIGSVGFLPLLLS
ncbi:DUF4190 domain-containing protein [Microbacterium sp. TWP3-1-2b2]|uniref:DUF4190 domain-containing protein n=1 Tax=Microbacterium sp. TWP3-1-2b2 TaxID=2804651 RepID=UPI003CEFB0DD